MVVLTGSSSVLSPVYRVSRRTPPQVSFVVRGAEPIRPETAGAALELAPGAGAGSTGCGANESASRSSSSGWLAVSGRACGGEATDMVCGSEATGA